MLGVPGIKACGPHSQGRRCLLPNPRLASTARHPFRRSLAQQACRAPQPSSAGTGPVMFLPRSSPGLSSPHVDASSSPAAGAPASSKVTSIDAAGGSGVRQGMNRHGPSSGAWSQPTTAPASVQVHYHYLAGRYRDLSYERGLGLVRSGMASSTSNATLGGIPEGDRGDEEGSIHSQTSASNSLRAIARNSGIRSDADHHSSRRRLEDLFLGGIGAKERRMNGQSSSSRADLAPVKAAGEYSKVGGPHGAKHASLRSYAEERIKAQELVEARVQRATDTGRLKWEAKAAMLNNSFGLAILLLLRAAQLGSVSASLSLSHLYAKGVTRGSMPVVVLVHREPLRSLSWALEAARLLQHRAVAKEKRRGGPSLLGLGTDEADQPAQIVGLLARLLRTSQSGLATPDEPLLLPVRRSRSAKDGVGQQAEGAPLWESVCAAMAWLDGLLPLPSTSALRDDGESIGPDDDESDPETIKRLQTRTQIALIEALVATKRWVLAQDGDKEARFRMQSCWSNFSSKLQAEEESHSAQQGNLSALGPAAEALVQELGDARQVVAGFQEVLDKSLVESVVPVASSLTLSRPAKLESPSKRRANQHVRRRMSLEELPPMDADAKKVRERAARPSLLKHHSQRTSQPAAPLMDVNASAKVPHRTGRAISLQGSTQRPALSSSATQDVHRATLQQHLKRPASVMSDSPSLLFASHDEESDAAEEREREQSGVVLPDKETGMTSSASLASSLWEGEAGSRHVPRADRPGGSKQERQRVTSLYGTPSVAPSEPVYTEGSTTFDYDIETSLRRQQARRQRGDSNASISTVASMLSTNPSLTESMAASEYAKGQFSSASTSNYINGFDLRLGGAADSLRRIRKTSRSEGLSRDGPAAPQLTDTLEQLIASSTSYQAAKARTLGMGTRSRKGSSASVRSLTAFTSNNQRQSSRGDMRPPLLLPGGSGRALSALAIPTTMTDRSSRLRSPSLVSPTATTAGASTTHASLSSPGSMGALGSLRMLGRQASGGSTTRKAIPRDMKEEAMAIAHDETAAKKDGERGPNLRAFASVDPTSSGVATPRTVDSFSPPLSQQSSIADLAHAHNGSGNQSSTLDPALAEAEERSGLKTTSVCMVCGRKVVNAPVSKSGDVFCSRDCRIEMKRTRAGVRDKGKGREGVRNGIAG